MKFERILVLALILAVAFQAYGYAAQMTQWECGNSCRPTNDACIKCCNDAFVPCHKKALSEFEACKRNCRGVMSPAAEYQCNDRCNKAYRAAKNTCLYTEPREVNCLGWPL